MNSETLTQPNSDKGSWLLQAVDRVSIKPEDALAMADQYLAKSKRKYPRDSDEQHQKRVADKIVSRYSRLALGVGVGTGLPGVIPGFGSAVAILGGATADTVAVMKLQVDMCMCMAAAYGYDISSEDGRHLTFLIAATGSAQHAGAEAVTRVGSRAGVNMLRQYLRGGALQATKHAFGRVGVTFTRKAVEKAVPFGVGAVVGGGANYATTRFVGHQAKQWFIIDQTMETGGEERCEDLKDEEQSLPAERAAWARLLPSGLRKRA